MKTNRRAPTPAAGVNRVCVGPVCSEGGNIAKNVATVVAVIVVVTIIDRWLQK